MPRPPAKKSATLHPAERFAAPAAILRGSPLKALLGKPAVTLLAESFALVVPEFDSARFRRQALRGLESLELTERSMHLARALSQHLPSDFEQAAPLVIRSLGPKLDATSNNGMAPFFYLPHSNYIATYGSEHFAAGMEANYHLTSRFTAEFSIRPFLVAHQDKCLKLLARWTADKNPHVRRLVSEGTRPRLPWAMRLRAMQSDPSLALPLLEKLKDDDELYVRRSVANHLADIAKDHPALAFEICSDWLRESRELPPPQAQARRWLIRHAVRLPAKKGVPAAVKLRSAAK